MTHVRGHWRRGPWFRSHWVRSHYRSNPGSRYMMIGAVAVVVGLIVLLLLLTGAI